MSSCPTRGVPFCLFAHCQLRVLSFVCLTAELNIAPQMLPIASQNNAGSFFFLFQLMLLQIKHLVWKAVFFCQG